MKDLKHTSGEWSVKSNPELIWIESPLWHIATISSKPNNETKANAKLIAAAPDLLAVCIDIMKEYIMNDDKPECYDSLCEAIKKATE